MEALNVEKIEKRFDAFHAVNDVTFSVERGEFLTLLGPSGCGKTTLLKLIGGFYTPTSGTIRIEGKDVTRDPPEKRNTTMCFQSYALFPHLTVRENILFGLKQQKMPTAEQTQRFDTVSHQVDLKTQIDKYPSMLSGGQQQRVALARSLVMRSGIILFDEPLSNLDAKLRERVRIEIRKLQKEYGFTAIYVTHDQSEALAMSDHIIVMNKGQIEQEGSPVGIYSNPVNSFVADFIGTANILEAEIRSSEDNNTYRVISEWGEFTIQSSKEPPAKKCRIAWRPEDAQMEFADTTSNVFTSEVEATAYQGNLTDIFISDPHTPGKRFRIQAPRESLRAAGEKVRYHIPSNAFKFLEAVS